MNKYLWLFQKKLNKNWKLAELTVIKIFEFCWYSGFLFSYVLLIVGSIHLTWVIAWLFWDINMPWTLITLHTMIESIPWKRGKIRLIDWTSYGTRWTFWHWMLRRKLRRLLRRWQIKWVTVTVFLKYLKMQSFFFHFYKCYSLA